MGKTALAAEAVWRLAPEEQPPERFPDGVIFHSFYNQPQVAIALEKIALAYGEEPRPNPVEAARRVLAGKRALLILDGAENADDLPAVLKVRDRCGVLVTTRDRRDAPKDRTDLKPLEKTKAVELLQSWAGEFASEKVAAEEICRRVGYLPLAVRLIGRYLERVGEEAQDYMLWLTETPLEALDQGERQEQSVPLLLERSLEQVGENARLVMAVAGVLALDSFDIQSVAAALDLPVNSLRPELATLVSSGLLMRAGKRYGISHPLIHTYARERCTPTSLVVQRLAAFYDGYAREQTEQGIEGYARLDDERVHIMNVIEACGEQGEWEAAKSLVWAVDGYLDICGYWTEWVMALETGMESARYLDERKDEDAFLDKLGIAHHSMGKVKQAIEFYQQALSIAGEIGDRRAESAHLGNLGLAHRSLGQVDFAIEYFQQALVIQREIGDRHLEGNQLGNLGLAYSDLGQVEQAIEFLQQSQKIHHQIGDRRSEGADLGNLGTAYYSLGQVENAVEFYKQALSIAVEIGDRRAESAHLSNLGMAYLGLEQVEVAIEYTQQALTIAQEIGDRHLEGNQLGNLGLAYSDLEQMEQAIEYYQQALTIAQEIDHRRNEGGWLCNLGLAYNALGQVEKAREYLKEALIIFEEIKSPTADQVRGWLDQLDE
jgi:tetratricopeptide (TPR) repeat protein